MGFCWSDVQEMVETIFWFGGYFKGEGLNPHL
jgi:hypothetical protein